MPRGQPVWLWRAFECHRKVVLSDADSVSCSKFSIHEATVCKSKKDGTGRFASNKSNLTQVPNHLVRTVWVWTMVSDNTGPKASKSKPKKI